jgi:tetratricopeptide (TPR) repeat protein
LKQKSISYLFVCFLLFLSVQKGYAQSVTAIKKRADAAFVKKEYESAKVDYRQLLAQNQKNLELNYKYATCIYFTEDIKNARKYFDFILAKKDAVFPLETYYYIGKIYQHQYYFETAIQQFNRLKEKDPKLAVLLDVQAEINACQSALAGMKDMRTLQVIKKSQPYGEAFYDHYTFLDDSYSFYKASEVFSKENTKHQYEPIYAFKRGMKFRVFASYGPESPNLDVYMQRKNSDNEWGKPIRIQGSVNTVEDEVYPFFDAENGYLYFSSKGHQSMGGFDLYRAIYSLETNLSSDVENLHFPFSSPNDDYFYIPDLSNGNANFASNRNGKLSAIQTYLVNAAETPKELYFFTGILSDKIDQSNSNVKVEFIVPETNERFGPFISQSDGTYLVGLPGIGAYQMEISVTGSNQLFKEQIIIPLVEEDMELQQELIYSMVDSKEQLKVVNRVKPKQVESLQMLSQKMNLAANLDVNLASFTRKVDLTLVQKMQQDWGVSVKDSSSLIAILSDSLLAAEVNLENQVRLTNYLANELEQTLAQLTKEMQALDTHLERGSGTIDPIENQQWIEETKQLESKVAKLEEQVRFLESWMIANQQRGIPNVDVLKNLEEINKQISLLQYQQNSAGIMELLSENRLMIKAQLSVAGEDLAAVIRNYTEEQVAAVLLEQKQYQEQLENQITLQKEITNLKEQAALLKPKDRTAIDAQIQQKEVLSNKINGELSEWSENLKTQEQGLRSFDRVEKEVQERIIASEKMMLPTSAIPFNLAAEQKRQEEIARKRSEQQKVLTKQVESAQEWTSVDPTYSQDIARINQESDAQRKATLLKAREEQHLQALKNKAATVKEVDQELLAEQIQLTENRVKTQGDLLVVTESVHPNGESEQGAATTNTNTTAQQGTGTEQGAGNTATNTIAQQNSETVRRGGESEQGAATTNTNTTAQQGTGTEQGAGNTATNTIAQQNSETVRRGGESEQGAATTNTNTTAQQGTVTEQGAGNTATNTIAQQNTETVPRGGESEQGANTTNTNTTAQQGTETEQGAGNTATNTIAQQNSETVPRGGESEQGASTTNTNTTAQQGTGTEQGAGNTATNTIAQQNTETVPRGGESEQGAATTNTNTTAQQGTGTEQGAGNTATNTIAQQNTETVRRGGESEQGANTTNTNTTAQQRTETVRGGGEIENGEREREAGLISTVTNTAVLPETNIELSQTILVDQVKDTPRMRSIEQAIREVEQISSTSISPNEKEALKAELEETLVLEKRRAAIKESLELVGTNYPIVQELQNSFEQEIIQVNTLTIQSLEQAFQSENNPEKAKLLQLQIEALKSNQANSTNAQSSSSAISPNPSSELILPSSSGDPENLGELKAQSTYVQYARQRIIYQQTMIDLDSLLQVKSQVEDSMRILLTQANEISIQKLQKYAERHSEITQNIERSRLDLQKQREQLVAFTDQTSYEWMMQNGIQASSMIAATNVVSNTAVSSTSVPFAMTTVTTMNQRFPDHPINVSLPNGLIFRVQVGAFRKPVPNQLFREFGPVSGEVLTNGLTCYLAGYFNGSVDAVEARTMIRRLGYADAFIVAYCDGKRMSFNEGKVMEANGTCRKQTTAELQLAINQLMQQNQTTVETTSPVVPKAAIVDPNSTEANLDLYYTVQVAVYNRALNTDNINGIKELLVTKTEKGQFRYSSGEFTSFVEARQRKNEVVTKGIPDAYVVAYYRGKRISIGEANQLLASGIVPKKRGGIVPVETNHEVQLATTIEIPILKPLVKRDTIVQFELKVNEDNFLSQLTRLNRIGTFTYQAEKNRIVSEKFVLDKININQQLYLADMKRIREKATKIQPQEFVLNPTRSDFYDWLLHQTVTYDVRQENEVYIFRFYPENEEQKEWINAASKQFKWTLKQK